MANTFAPPVPPAYDGTTREKAYRTITAQFGDGYQQDMPDGLNAGMATATYAWKNVSYAVANYIDGFLDANMGKTFLWSPPDMQNVTKWKAVKGATITPVGFNLCEITIQIKQSFEIV